MSDAAWLYLLFGAAFTALAFALGVPAAKRADAREREKRK